MWPAFRRSYRVALTTVLGIGWALQVGSGSAESAQAGGAEKKVGAELFYLDNYDVSPPLRDMHVIPPDFEEREDHPVKMLPHRHALRPLGSVRDLAVQTGAGPSVDVTPGLNFDGVGIPSYSVNAAPPDTVGAVGATQYVQWVNTAFAVFDKTTGAMVYGPASGNTLWQGFGGRCETDNSGDPIVGFDKAANRWIMTQFAIDAEPYMQCIAVSTSSDATGSYRRFAYSFGSDFNDYPKVGVWPDAYYITFNMFKPPFFDFTGARACAFDRNQMLTETGMPAPMQCFQLSTAYGGLLPSDLDGSTPPPVGAPNTHLAFDDAGLNGLNLWTFHVDWNDAADSTFTGPVKVPAAAFTEACNGGACITQPGTTQRLDSLADRLMYRLAYRNFGTHESLVVNHSVDVNAQSGVRWYELRDPGGTPTLHQQGTYSPDATHRWMGSIAQDKDGNMLLGYSASSTSVRPSIRYTGRLAADPLGTMQAESEMHTGAGSQTAGLRRWGDYSAMTIDPVDDCTFWYTTEYLKTSGSFNWSTRVASFKFPSCGNNGPPRFSVTVSPSSLILVPGGTLTTTVTVTSVNGFSGPVTLTASEYPSSVTTSFSSNPVTPPAGGSATSTLTITAAPAALNLEFGLAVAGTSPDTPTSVFSVRVAISARFDPTLKVPKCEAVDWVCDSGPLLDGRDGKGPEPNEPNTINGSCADGTSGNYHFDESSDRIRVQTLDGTSLAPGKTVQLGVWVWAWTTPSADALDLYYSADANNPSWTYITTLIPSFAGPALLATTYTLPEGNLQAVRARFRYHGGPDPCSVGPYDDHDDLVFTAGEPPDTTPPETAITAPENGATVGGGTTLTASATDNVGVTEVRFFIDDVLRATDTTSPYTYDWDTSTYGNRTHRLSAEASDAAGNVGKSAVVTVTVNNLAVFDPTLRTPKCSTVGGLCDSGTLLDGRDGKGPEINQPNTISNSCADGSLGTYHFDESMDRIRVSTPDGSSFLAGKTVQIDATVWAWTNPSVDALDLYYAADATSPSWVFIGTLVPSLVGAETLSTTYTLPPGNLQAVRARFRYGGSAAPCSVGDSGGYDDHDDLVFAVGSGAPDDIVPTTSITAPANGREVSGTTTVTASASDDVGLTEVELYIDGALVASDFTSPYRFSWDTTTYANGSHALATRAYDAAGNVGKSSVVAVTVNNPKGLAVYDPTLMAPKCGTVGDLCHSGSLLNGRDGIGPEPNQPNTIGSSCADGTAGSYHLDESIDRISVFVPDGTSFAPGKTVHFQVTFWAWTTPSADALDLYYAADATNPSWTYIGTVTPPIAGEQVVGRDYTLPSGRLQAVRARLRYQGSEAPCGGGSYDDHDDLIFAVGSEGAQVR